MGFIQGFVAWVGLAVMGIKYAVEGIWNILV